MSSLLRDEKLARRYEGGNCFVFRLCVNHYHRYCYADSGKRAAIEKISGVLHTVNPIATSRKFLCLRKTAGNIPAFTPHILAPLLQMEVGTMLVGRIVIIKAGEAARGEKEGMFQYGGSTIILLTEKGTGTGKIF